MTNIKALGDLIAAVERGDTDGVANTSINLPTRSWGCFARLYLGPNGYPNYRNDISTLRAILAPSWVVFEAGHTCFGYEISLTNGEGTVYACSDVSPARAWLIAILKAYRAQMEA